MQMQNLDVGAQTDFHGVMPKKEMMDEQLLGRT
jgi:hypothetical protein